MFLTEQELNRAKEAWQNADTFGRKVFEELLGTEIFKKSVTKRVNNEMQEVR